MNYLSFKEFDEKYGLKNEATSKVKIKENLDTLSVFGILKLNSTGIYMRDDKITTPSGIVNLHPTKGTHWVMFVNEYYFDSYGCPPPTNILNLIKKVSIQNIKFRKMIVIVQHIVYTFYFSHKFWASKMQY